jgi:murein DD-endopeptidase MepM/ murein hydrolase activator NlpD
MPPIGKQNAASAATLCCAANGLTLPLMVDAAWCCWMQTIAMNGGDVNSWYDHDASCNGTMKRYDGTSWSVGNCGGGCTEGVSCYDGHNGIDFRVVSSDGVHGPPVYAASNGTLYLYTDMNCGNGIVIADSTDSRISTLYCHLDNYLSGITNGMFVYQGQKTKQWTTSGCRQ